MVNQRPVDPCLSRWHGTPGRCSGEFLKFMCLFLSWIMTRCQSSCPAEVWKWKFSPFFSAKGVVRFSVKFGWNFPRYVFQGLGVRRKGVGDVSIRQKTREGCGCPKCLAGKVFRQIATLLVNSSSIFRQHEMLSLPRFGHLPARKIFGCWRIGPAFANPPGFSPLRPPQPSCVFLT